MIKQNIEYKRFVWELSNLINKYKENKKIIFVCVGTNKVTGDSLGPIVGSLLKEQQFLNKRVEVIGDLKHNINYNNIDIETKNIKNNLNNLVIVIDSALANEENVGEIIIQNRGLKYGEGLKKNNYIIGDISIKAVVGRNFKNSIKNFYLLKKVPFKKITQLAGIISSGIIDVVENV